ncbi:MAG: hypothetical protein QGH94_18930, partial [Phycisphaerae bacterium]|nr:hypothetical protein [Phycisphaerae bacterium]
MTTFGADNIRCAHCGEVSEHMVLGSSNTFLGSPDLDLRPAEMYRSTMSMWVQRCPTCDYCAPDISKIHRKVRKHIDSDELKAALSDTAVPELARRFAACAVLEQKAGRLYEAASGFHCAAWACDDESEDQLAMEFRRKTIELLTEMRQRRIPFDRAGQYEAVLTDLLRRVGEFDSAGAECQAGVALVSDNSVPLEIFELQRELIAAGDTAAHSVPEIPPTPEELEAQQRAAKYQINYHELDLPLVVDYKGYWPGVIDGQQIVLNAFGDDALLVECTVLEISHPMLGAIRGLYTEGLDYTFVLDDYSQAPMEAEESPGLIYHKNAVLEPNQLDVVLWRPNVTDIPYKYAYSGLYREELKMLWRERDRIIREKLRITGP